MNKFLTGLTIVGLVIIICVGTYFDYKRFKQNNLINRYNKPDTVLIHKIDTIYDNTLCDSLLKINDSISEQLIISNIKLERIKEYNRIAAKGNNIKYLRGWINRVLSE